MTKQRTLSGWGRHRAPGREQRSEDLERATRGAVLSRGLGRSYGDSSLPATPGAKCVNTTLADRILSFDADTGVLRAESGLSLLEINRLLLPRGWFTPVTPGTQFVTLGGMVASDVHGKNHHVDGCFGDHVTAMKMRVADGRVLEVGPDRHPELHRATLGGMGLTGHILEVEVPLRRIPSRWIVGESRRIDDIDEYQVALEEEAKRWPYTVGWIDSLSRGARMGRGVLMSGRWAEAHEAPTRPPRALPRPRLPFDLPGFVLGRASVAAFNELYFRRHVPRVRQGLSDPMSFFYPLDAVHDWNRAYGKRGFTQYQCVLPREAGAGSARRFLELLTSLGCAAFLNVIKDFGEEGTGTLSFPRPGITLALDIPVRKDTQEVVDALNRQVIEEGGRIYLSKDSFTRAEDYARMDPRVPEFERVRDIWDPERRFRSAQSVRIFGDDR